MKLFVYPPLFILLLSVGAFAQWTWAVDPTPTLAPSCQCVDCKCDPCKCVKPLVSAKKRNTPTEASVKVTTYLSEGRSRPHTGTAICEHTIITCAHGFDTGSETVTVDGKPARLIKIDFKEDVAMLRTEHSLKFVDVADAAPKLGEQVVGYGFEQERQIVKPGLWRFDTSVIGVNEWKGLKTVTVGMRAKPGRSGGGLFNTQGQLVGVCKEGIIAYDASIYAGLPAIHKLIGQPCEFEDVKENGPKFQRPADPLKFALPEFVCPDGKCPLQRLPASKAVAPAQVTGAFSQCPNGQCSRPPAKIMPAPMRVRRLGR
jgi:trypsin-like peptidase